MNYFFYIAGLVFLFLAKSSHTLRGYRSPKPFPIAEHERCIAYDLDVVDHWLSFLSDYTKRNDSHIGKNVLELGPGSDLGVGLYLLSRGIAKYNAIDVNNLIKDVPRRFYELMFARLRQLDSAVDIASLQSQLEKTSKSENDRLNYICRDDFNIAEAFGKNTVDLVFSQAAFEHFDDIDATVSQLSQVVKSGGVIVAVIDLMTHSRWVRDKDPLSIYRYGKRIYNFFGFRGIPNRIRPYQYMQIFQKYGWENIVIKPLTRLDDSDLRGVLPSLNRSFRDPRNQMEYLTILFCATRV